jgi:hypothetical protein
MKGQSGYWKFTMYCPDCRRAVRAWVANKIAYDRPEGNPSRLLANNDLQIETI